MAECSECGKQSMNFTCKYCGEKYCSTHRLPENHDCDSLEEGIEQEEEESQEWFQEKDIREELKLEEKNRGRKPPSGAKWWASQVMASLKKNATLMIIGVTTAVFIIQAILGDSPNAAPFYEAFILQAPLENVLSQPWTLLTVMFLHGSAFHIFANMITLYFFGRPVENVIGSKDFLKFYFAAGLAASIGFVLVQNIRAVYLGPEAFVPAVGASGAVVACFAAVAMLYPNAKVLLYFIIPMNIKTLLYAFAAFEFVNMSLKMFGIYLPVVGGLASSAHLTGLVVGVIYGKRLRDKYGSKSSVIDIFSQ